MTRLVQRALSIAVAGMPLSACLLNVYDQSVAQRGQSMSIRLFAVKTMPEYKGSVEDLRVQMAEELKKRLTKTRYYRSVEIVAEDIQVSDGLVIAGEFQRIQQRSGLLGGALVIEVSAAIRRHPGDNLLADFHCISDGRGGLDAFRHDGATGKGIPGIADKFTKLTSLEKEIEKLKASRERKPLEASVQESGGGGLLSKPKEIVKLNPIKLVRRNNKNDQPKADSASDEGDSEQGIDVDDEEQDEATPSRGAERRRFLRVSARSFEKSKTGWRQVVAAWVTADAYDAHRKLRQLPTGRGSVSTATSNEVTPTTGAMFLKTMTNSRVHFGALENAASHFDDLGKTPAYVFAIWFSKLYPGPIFWDRERLQQATLLHVPGAGDVRPLRVIDPAVPPGWSPVGKFKVQYRTDAILVAFPTHFPDGKPVISSANSTVELHTEFEGHPVLIRYQIEKTGITDVQRLLLKAPRSDEGS